MLFVVAISLLGQTGQERNLDQAILESVANIYQHIRHFHQGTIIAVDNISATSYGEKRGNDISIYITNEISKHLNNINIGRRFIIRDRIEHIDIGRREITFGESEEVNERTAQNRGQFIGAQIVIYGSIKPMGNSRYYLEIRAAQVETWQNLYLYTMNINTEDFERKFSPPITPSREKPRRERPQLPSWDPEVDPVVFIGWGLSGESYKIIMELGLQSGIAFNSFNDNYLSLLLDINGGIGFDSSYSTNDDESSFSTFNLGGLIEYRFAKAISFGAGGGIGGMNGNMYPYIRGAVSILFFDGDLNFGAFYDYNFEFRYKFGVRMYGNLLTML